MQGRRADNRPLRIVDLAFAIIARRNFAGAGGGDKTVA